MSFPLFYQKIIFLQEYKSNFTHKPLLSSSTSLLKLNKYIFNAERTEETVGVFLFSW